MKTFHIIVAVFISGFLFKAAPCQKKRGRSSRSFAEMSRWQPSGDCRRPSEGNCSYEGRCCGEETGEQTYERYCKKPGKCNPKLRTSKVKACRIVCQVEEQQAFWSSWTALGGCSVSCGQGTVMYNRTCIGSGCPGENVRVVACTQPSCAHWTVWVSSGCSVSCGNGTETYRRMCEGEGRCNGSAAKTEPCKEQQPCATWTEWESHGCSATCGIGTNKSTRICTGVGKCGGEPVKYEPCLGEPCAVWTEWKSSGCSVSCGTGTEMFTRLCLGAGDCQGDTVLKGQCVQPKCEYGKYGEWKREKKCRRPKSGWCSDPNTCCGKRVGLRRVYRKCDVKGTCHPQKRNETVIPCNIQCNRPEYASYGPWKRASNCKRPKTGECSEEGTCCMLKTGGRTIKRRCKDKGKCHPNLLSEKSIPCTIICKKLKKRKADSPPMVQDPSLSDEAYQGSTEDISGSGNSTSENSDLTETSPIRSSVSYKVGEPDSPDVDR